jgi:hypothetical protein
MLLVLSAIGICAVSAAPHPYVALAGFALMGAGCTRSILSLSRRPPNAQIAGAPGCRRR